VKGQDSVADDERLRQFYNRAVRTLSIAFESFQKLKSEGAAGAEVSLTRLELELATWNSEVAALERYNAAVQDFNTAHASWRHSGIGEPPEAPGWPSEVPNFRPAVESIILKFNGSSDVSVDNGLTFNIAQIRESLKESWPIERDLPSMALMLQVIGLNLDEIKQKLEEKPVEVQQKPPMSLTASVIDELVTLNQCAPLCGVSKRTLERWLQDGKLPPPDVPGGVGRANKWHWNTIRQSLQREISRQLPERFPGTRII
jgi:predicted DNA-binding transcriptional regulator AlpA